MAKDLPYFKFFVSEWNDGDITLEDYAIQGLFINVCSYYWSKECLVPLTTLKKKFKHYSNDIDSLISDGFIKVNKDNISISFLNEQLNERLTTSKNNSVAGKASAEARRLKKLEKESNTILTPVELPLNTKPTIKRREEKKREEIPPIETFMIYLKTDYLKDDSERYVKVRQRMIDTYNAWKLNDWKDGNDKPIKNWKVKAINQLRYIKL